MNLAQGSLKGFKIEYGLQSYSCFEVHFCAPSIVRIGFQDCTFLSDRAPFFYITVILYKFKYETCIGRIFAVCWDFGR